MDVLYPVEFANPSCIDDYGERTKACHGAEGGWVRGQKLGNNDLYPEYQTYKKIITPNFQDSYRAGKYKIGFSGFSIQSILTRISCFRTVGAMRAHPYAKHSCKDSPYLNEKGIRCGQWVFGQQDATQIITRNVYLKLVVRMRL